MPQKLLKRLMPAKQKLMSNSSIQYLGNWILNANVWHFNRRSASRAVLIGIFWAFFPFPMQMIFAAIVCIYMRANLPLTMAFVWITNPFTAVPVFYATYRFGAMILGLPVNESFEFSMEEFSVIWRPLLLGSIICGVSLSAIGYTVVDFLWRWRTIKRWEKRREKSKL